MRCYCVFICISLLLLHTTIKAQDLGCSNTADVIFVLDGSESLSIVDFNRMKSFVWKVVSNFTAEITSRQLQLGVVVFGTEIYSTITLNDYTNYANFVGKLATLRREIGVTATDIALNRMRLDFANHGRSNARKVGVVITDGRSNNPQQTQTEAISAKQEDIYLIAIGYGNSIFIEELLSIASSTQSVFTGDDFNTLVNTVRVGLDTAICEPPTAAPSSGGLLNNSVLCPNCMIGMNHGYLEYEGYCGKFIQVYTDSQGNQQTAVRKCSDGLFWDQYTRTCRRPQYVSCQYDPCLNLTSGSTYAIDHLCSGYMMCVQGRSTRSCCGATMRFVPGTGCFMDRTCQDTCDGPGAGNDGRLIQGQECRFTAVATNTALYTEEVPGHGPVVRPCPLGTRFNETSCLCSTLRPIAFRLTRCSAEARLTFDTDFSDSSGKNLYIGSMGVALEGGGVRFSRAGSVINMYRFAGDDFGSSLYIRVRFQPSGNGEALQALVTNCIFSSEASASIAILVSVSNRTVILSASTFDGTASMDFPYNPIQMNDVQYIYDGENLTGVVNGVKRQERLRGNLLIRSSGLVMGAGSELGYYDGLIDEFELYKCIPDSVVSLTNP